VERGLSELAATIAAAVGRAEKNAKQALFSQVDSCMKASGLEPDDATLRKIFLAIFAP